VNATPVIARRPCGEAIRAVNQCRMAQEKKIQHQEHQGTEKRMFIVPFLLGDLGALGVESVFFVNAFISSGTRHGRT